MYGRKNEVDVRGGEASQPCRSEGIQVHAKHALTTEIMVRHQILRTRPWDPKILRCFAVSRCDPHSRSLISRSDKLITLRETPTYRTGDRHVPGCR